MEIENRVLASIKEAVQAVYDIPAEEHYLKLQPTKRVFEGDLTFVTFPLAKPLRKNPEEIGRELGAYLVENAPDVQDFNAVKGFLNLVLSKATVLRSVEQVLNDADFGQSASNGQTVMVEYSSPNTNKPLHLGHLRNNFLGYSISAILKAAGYDVVKANLINDRGIHICKSMVAYEQFGEGETPQSSGQKGDHLIGKYYVLFDKKYKAEVNDLVEKGVDKKEAEKTAPLMIAAQEMLRKWEQNDDEVHALWQKMNSWVYEGFETTYQKIGVDFDQYYYESDTYLLGKKVVEDGLEKGVFYKKDDQSVWVDLRDEGLDEKLVLRGDGTSVYITQDIGTADLKYNDYKLDQSVYVVGNEQDYHFIVLKKILNKLGRPYADGIYHMSYGMVDLPSGKMKSREGTVVDADDLVDEMISTAGRRTRELGKIDDFTDAEAQQLYEELALGALKYFILRVDPKKRMLFNPEESIDFQGDTGPFIQYTHARISSLLRKADEMDIAYTTFMSPVDYTFTDHENLLMNLLGDYPKKVKDAAKQMSPSVIANYVFDLAKAYNRFYAEVAIFKGDNQNHLHFRLSLSCAVAKVIRNAMGLLGVHVPDRM